MSIDPPTRKLLTVNDSHDVAHSLVTDDLSRRIQSLLRILAGMQLDEDECWDSLIDCLGR